MVLRYYYDLMSQPCRAIYIFLKINKIPFEPKPIALRKGEHHSDEYKKVNPFSLVPVLNDDGFILTESVAILKYLAEKYNAPENWYPRDDIQAQARIDEYMNWQHWNTRLKSAKLFQSLLFRRMNNKSEDSDTVDLLRAEVEKTVNYFEQVWLKDRPFLCGKEISFADILGVCELIQLSAVYEEKLYEKSPVVKSWMERVKDSLQPQFDEAHKIIYGVRKMYANMKEQPAKL
ncbi:GST [Mytilus edulis]|uniref:GST n=1 Tax=Mytilus edulis TaxID=6550 RepID=A0A8S3QBD4_MYTED|nr:GST [Mytilus edulis]